MLLIRTVDSIVMIAADIYVFQYLIFTSLSSNGESKLLSTSFMVLMVKCRVLNPRKFFSQSCDITLILQSFSQIKFKTSVHVQSSYQPTVLYHISIMNQWRNYMLSVYSINYLSNRTYTAHSNFNLFNQIN